MAQDDRALLVRLKKNGLDFVVIGGVCCVYYGVPIATFDLDICCKFDEPNLRRIEAAVGDLHPFHRLTTNKLPLELTSERPNVSYGWALRYGLLQSSGVFSRTASHVLQATCVAARLRHLEVASS